MNTLSNFYMKPTKETISKKRIYGFDIETYGKGNIFLMGSIVNKEEKYIFWDKKEMQNFIFHSNKIRNSLLFATNLGFDFLALFGDDFNLMKNFNIVMRGSDFISINTLDSKQGVTFLDTFSFYRGSVKTIGEIIGIPKLKKPEFIGKKVNRYSKEGQYLEEYNIRDSLISGSFDEFLQDSFNSMGANIKYTIASTSKHLFTNKYLKHWIRQPSKEIIGLLYNGYYGGRTEAFIRGKIDNLNYYDINSLYPFVMKNMTFPNPNTIKYSPKSNIDIVNKYEGLSYCEIIIDNFDKNFIPLLPHRTDDKLLFPLGKFYGYHSHIELRKALELGYHITPIFSIYYTKTFNPFSEFINDLYKKRLQYKKEGNKMQLVAKILMNSLYGKFSQKIQQSKILFPDNQEHFKELKYYINENIILQSQDKELRYKIDSAENRTIFKDGKHYDNSRLYYVTDLFSNSFPKFINPILSIYITSYARLELYKYFEEIKKTKNKLYYCDTDSIITDKKFKTSSDLGGLKLEFNIKKGIIVKPKFYYLEDKKVGDIVKAKGLSNLKSLIDFQGILKTGEYRYIKFSKFKESLKQKLHFNEKIDILKVIDLNDNKRNWFEIEFNENETQESTARIIIEEIN